MKQWTEAYHKRRASQGRAVTDASGAFALTGLRTTGRYRVQGYKLGWTIETTGGRALFSPSAGQLRKAFRDVAEDLRHQYSIAYSSSDTTRDGKWRKIRIETANEDLTVIGRKGYFASDADSGSGSAR